MLKVDDSLDTLLSVLSFESLGFPNMEDASAFVKPHPGPRYFGLLEDITYYSSRSSSSSSSSSV